MEEVLKLNFQDGNISSLKSFEKNIFMVTENPCTIYQCAYSSGSIKNNTISKYDIINRIDLEKIGKCGGVSVMEGNILIADSHKKVLYSVDKDSFECKPILSLLALKGNEMGAVLNNLQSEITDIEYSHKKIWFSCSAGYSSSIFSFDINSKKLSFEFFTRGSMPGGLHIEDSKKLVYVLDSVNKEISSFDMFTGKWTGDKQRVSHTGNMIPWGLTMSDNKLIISYKQMNDNK